MPRIRQTARKSTGRALPRRRRSLYSVHRKKSKEGKSNTTTTTTTTATTNTTTNTTDEDRGCLSLGFSFSDGINDVGVVNVNDVTKKPAFPLTDTDLVKEYQPGFTVRRHTAYAEDVLDVLELGEDSGLVDKKDPRRISRREFIQSVCKQAKSKFPSSSWMILCFTSPSKNKIWMQPEEEDPKSSSSRILTEILRTGMPHGCELRGTKETVQLGLVATQDLPKDTPVCVEAGLIWSEDDHNREVLSHNPMLGLSSNYIPADLLKGLATKTAWKTYKKNHELIEDGKKKTEGFVIDCSTHGNETKHIDDPGWLQAGANQPPIESNLEALMVLDLVRSLPTVGFFTKHNVKKNEELTMDWGCWEEISHHFLPGQTLASLLAHNDMVQLIEKCNAKGIDSKLICIKGAKKVNDQKPIFFQPKDAEKVREKVLKESQTMQDDLSSKKVTLLCEIMGRNTIKSNKRAKTSDGFTPIKNFDYKSLVSRVATFPRKYKDLSRKARQSLKICAENLSQTSSSVMGDLLAARDLSERVQIVEIRDAKHPACLFGVPNEPCRGVITNREFKKGEAILCYGGELKDFETSDLEFDSYLFDLDLSPYGYTGPDIFIAGNGSVGGMINDPRSIGSTKAMEANIVSAMEWDEKSNTPQIVFIALRNLKKGEELLYDYGVGYWKVMWRAIMMSHAAFTATTELQNEEMRKALGEEKESKEEQ